MSTVANMKNKTETREGYKKTELGWLPKEWAEINLGSLCQVTAGGTPSTTKAEYWGGHIPWMNSGEINLKQIYDVAGRITKLGLDNSSTKLLPKNCVLIALAGQGSTRGKVAINRIELCTNQSIAAYIVSSNNLDFEFLYHNLASRYNELRLISSGNETRGGLNLTILRSVKIYLPPLPEQEKIAEILSCWDQAIETMEKLITAKIKLKKALMKRLLTPKPHWGVIKVSELGEVVTGCTPNTQINEFYENGDKPWVTPIDLDKKKYINNTKTKLTKTGFKETRILPAKSILITCIGSTIGKVGLSCTELSTNQQINSIICKGNFDAEFYYYAICKIAKFIKYLATEHAVPICNKTQLSNFLLPQPEYKEQKKIAEILSCWDQAINLYRQNLELIKNQKKGLLQRLMTGSIRVTIKEC